jgi:hypothetical protein
MHPPRRPGDPDRRLACESRARREPFLKGVREPVPVGPEARQPPGEPLQHRNRVNHLLTAAG